mmetsp:Transcript_54545/g.165810  ORF Transcript_54545/g.165810 Transcript_54545/m.165810 type:complete len:281 (+) Transcript_54545:1316-2158(+)
MVRGMQRRPARRHQLPRRVAPRRRAPLGARLRRARAGALPGPARRRPVQGAGSPGRHRLWRQGEDPDSGRRRRRDPQPEGGRLRGLVPRGRQRDGRLGDRRSPRRPAGPGRVRRRHGPVLPRDRAGAHVPDGGAARGRAHGRPGLRRGAVLLRRRVFRRRPARVHLLGVAGPVASIRDRLVELDRRVWRQHDRGVQEFRMRHRPGPRSAVLRHPGPPRQHDRVRRPRPRGVHRRGLVQRVGRVPRPGEDDRRRAGRRRHGDRGGARLAAHARPVLGRRGE